MKEQQFQKACRHCGVWRRSWTVTAALAVLISIQVQAQYAPPAGIPTPPFGINETPEMYTGSGATFDYGSGPVGYRTNEFGPFTHYIDNTHPAATDTSNPYGTPDKPRRTWPYPLPAGSLVQLHGGPYNFVNAVGAKLAIGGAGSQAKPIFFYGTATNAAGMPTISAPECYFWGDWVIVDGIRFANSCVGSTRPLLKGAPVRNTAIRNCLFEGTGRAGNQICVTTGGSTGTSPTTFTENLVLFRNVMRNYGDAAYASENDACGVVASQYATNIWILENDISDMGGDSIRIGADQGDTASGGRYFIGGNKLHDNRENGIDVKQARDSVIANNEIAGFRHSSSSSGEAIVIHYSPRNIWILNNAISDSDRGIVSTGVQDCYIIGNRVVDCSEYSLFLDRGGGTFYVQNNTIDSCGNGPVTSGTVNALHYRNNIVSGVTSASGYYLLIANSSVATASSANTFLFNQNGGGLRIGWGGATYSTPEQWTAATGKGQASFTADPMFVPDDSFTLSTNSPAIDRGVDYDTGLPERFQTTFGTSLRVDFQGDNRPSGTAMDIGADEFNPDNSTNGGSGSGGTTSGGSTGGSTIGGSTSGGSTGGSTGGGSTSGGSTGGSSGGGLPAIGPVLGGLGL